MSAAGTTASYCIALELKLVARGTVPDTPALETARLVSRTVMSSPARKIAMPLMSFGSMLMTMAADGALLKEIGVAIETDDEFTQRSFPWHAESSERAASATATTVKCPVML